MADKRELLLAVKGKDDGASRVLKNVGDEANKSGDKLDNMRTGLDALDKKITDTKTTIADLRKEIQRTGDVELFKDVNKATARLKNLGKQREFLTAGSDAAEGFSVSFSQRIGPLLARAPISGPMAAAMAAAAPSAVGVLSAAIAGGVAVAGVGAGVALAARNPAVKAAASDLSSTIGRELQFAARPFVPETLKAIGIVREGFLDLRPDLEGLFADAAEFVEPLTVGAVGGMKKLVPALRDVLHNADPVVDVLGDHLTQAADAAGTSLRLMTQDSEYTAKQLDQTLDAVEGLIVGFGGLVAAVNFLGDAEDKGEGFLKKLGPVGDAIKRTVNPVGSAIDKLGELGDLFGDNAEEANKVPPAVNAASASWLDANTAARIAADGTALYTDWLNKQNQAYENSIDDAINAERAALRFRDATVQARDAIDKKKGASDKERDALLTMIEAANTATRANEKQGVSSTVAAARHKTQRDALIAVATKMFGSRDAAIAYIDKLLQIPKSRRTEIQAQNAQALGAIATVRERLDRLNGKTIKTYIKVVTRNGIDQVTSNTGGGREVDDPSRRRRAAGGPVRRGVTYLVGEEGPELLTAPANGYITKASTTRRMMAGQGQAMSSKVDLSDASLERLARLLARAWAGVQQPAFDAGRWAAGPGRVG